MGAARKASKCFPLFVREERFETPPRATRGYIDIDPDSCTSRRTAHCPLVGLRDDLRANTANQAFDKTFRTEDTLLPSV
jgi:hypothetical protein